MRADDPLVLGIDPGARFIGMVLRFRDRLYAHHLIDCDVTKDFGTVIDGIRDFADEIPGDGDYLVGVEDVHTPTGFKHGKKEPINPKGIIGTALVLGAVRVIWPAAVVVPPGDNGSHPLRFYPQALVGPREGPAGTGRLRHCRSAWDVAGAAVRLSRMYRRARA